MKYKITVDVEWENDVNPEECFENIEDIKAVQKGIDDGNMWAWCCVKVSLVFPDFELSEYLGGCSYEDKEDFIKNSGYYEEMVNTLKQTVMEAAKSLS